MTHLLVPKFSESSAYPGAYIPISDFKSKQLFHCQDAVKTFASSGTSGQGRSRSGFSHDGLMLYKFSALSAFKQVLFAAYGKNYLKVPGVSLIPPSSVWPDSSLAQMISWFHEHLMVAYADENNLEEILSRLKSGPCWIFGTAFHYIYIHDQGFHFSLPPNSLVFETGGTKKHSRELSRNQLYKLIAKTFGIALDAIISEYSMCELSSQAYDYLTKAAPLAERRYRFPPWVQCYVYQGLGHNKDQGEGCLVVGDALRCDLPYPICTEDYVRLSADQSFQLLGRLSSAPLKGCSLMVDECPYVSNVVSVSMPLNENSSWQLDESRYFSKIVKTNVVLPGFLQSEETKSLFKREVISDNAARQGLLDLINSLPTTNEQWILTIKKALQVDHRGYTSVAKRWLIIAPANHSIACFYPLTVAAIAGLKVYLKLSARLSDEQNLLNYFVEFLKEQLSFELEYVDDGKELNRASCMSDVDAVMCFGEDETLKKLRTDLKKPLVGFGHTVAIGIISQDELYSEKDKIIKDAFSLAQKGCRALRVLLVKITAGQKLNYQDFITSLRFAFKNFWQNHLPLRDFLVLEKEYGRLKNIATAINAQLSFDEALFPVFDLRDIKFRHDMKVFLSDQRFVLPIILITEDFNDFYFSQLAHDKSIKLCAYSNAFKAVCDLAQTIPHLECQVLGSLNLKKWDGFYEKRPLFLSSL